ncbi:MAG TPA: uracil-DNA glycosylase [Geobacteraceae bacterium]|nr:uracil-DNA glycosylase [Geobacteraceae bacterium]
MQRHERQELLGALRDYLEDLVESGVEGLPLAAEPVAPSATVAVSVGQAAPAGAPTSQDRVAPVPSGRETLADIRADLGDCQRCTLSRGRNNIVFGVGDPAARLMFVGEAPGRDEDLKGEPFVGEAGQLLTKIIQAMGLQREDVYICNVLKCRPPENRNPHHDEIEACGPFMLRQVRAIAPRAIIALGTFAAQILLESKDPISRLRGRFHDYHGIPLMPTFHPAFLLRSPEKKREVWADVQQVMKLLANKA